MINSRSQNRRSSSQGRDPYGRFGNMYGGNENQARYSNNHRADYEDDGFYDEDDNYYTGSYDRNDRDYDEDNYSARNNYSDYDDFDDRYQDEGYYGNRAGRDQDFGLMERDRRGNSGIFDRMNLGGRSERRRRNSEYYPERSSERSGYGSLGGSSYYGYGRGRSGR
jgi:hypothetical protein